MPTLRLCPGFSELGDVPLSFIFLALVLGVLVGVCAVELAIGDGNGPVCGWYQVSRTNIPGQLERL
jgi:hypothetical protein